MLKRAYRARRSTRGTDVRDVSFCALERLRSNGEHYVWNRARAVG
jgi:hypothetical protein